MYYACDVVCLILQASDSTMGKLIFVCSIIWHYQSQLMQQSPFFFDLFNCLWMVTFKKTHFPFMDVCDCHSGLCTAVIFGEPWGMLFFKCPINPLLLSMHITSSKSKRMDD